jgi:hypothetical protein
VQGVTYIREGEQRFYQASLTCNHILRLMLWYGLRVTPAGRIEVSAQNHNFAVDPDTLPAGIEVSHINLNDGTCAGG